MGNGYTIADQAPGTGPMTIHHGGMAVALVQEPYADIVLEALNRPRIEATVVRGAFGDEVMGIRRKDCEHRWIDGRICGLCGEEAQTT